jgi:hypothetical protein
MLRSVRIEWRSGIFIPFERPSSPSVSAESSLVHAVEIEGMAVPLKL